jgi:hypothetical protein
MKNVAFLFVTCCLEDTRASLLNHVIENMQCELADVIDNVTVFDNASTIPSVREKLTSTFKRVFQSNRNVGYWSAIDWWLRSLEHEPPKYTYIIESDMIHYDFHRFWQCVDFLDHNDSVGSVRLHEYSVENWFLYDKDMPRADSKRTIWQSHINRVTRHRVRLTPTTPPSDIYLTNFLTQLPALNRFDAMSNIFKQLRQVRQFSEPDFQALYHQLYQTVGIIDRGIFNCDLNAYGSSTITGSWTNVEQLAAIGYQTTRIASIANPNSYTVQLL